jgi:hypothetical protein
LSTVDAQRGRLPVAATDRTTRIGEVLTEILDRPVQLATDPDALHRVIRLARVDLPASVQAYLNLPGRDHRAADELLAQLDLLETEAHRIAAAFYADDIQWQADHTRYLRERDKSAE